MTRWSACSGVLLLILSPLMWLVAVLALAAHRSAVRVCGGRRPRAAACAPPACTAPHAASVVIPNWNGRDLLEKYLPSVDRRAGRQSRRTKSSWSTTARRTAAPSSCGSAFPHVTAAGARPQSGFRRRLECRIPRGEERHRGAAEQRHARGRRISCRRCSKAFATNRSSPSPARSSFSDPAKLREETGLTQGWWQDGGLRVRHRIDPAIDDLYPVLLRRRRIVRLRPAQVSGAGRLRSAARALLSGRHRPRLHGLEARLEGAVSAAQRRVSRASRHHRQAFQRGANPGGAEEELPAVLLEEHSRVAAAGRRTSSSAYGGALLSVLFGDQPGRANLDGWWRAFRQLPGAMASAVAGAQPGGGRTIRKRSAGRWADTSATAFDARRKPATALRVLFVSPYPICPPVHGGGVFMYQTLRELARLCDVHVIAMLDEPGQAPAQEELRGFLRVGGVPGAAAQARRTAGIDRAARGARVRQRGSGLADPPPDLPEANRRAAARIHAAGAVRARVPAHSHRSCSSTTSTSNRSRAAWRTCAERWRASRRASNICARCATNCACCRAAIACRCARARTANTWPAFCRRCASRMQDGLRAGIDTARYDFSPGGREPYTMLFLGSFRHEPNIVALDWFVARGAAADRGAPAGSAAGGGGVGCRRRGIAYADRAPAIEMRGFVEDIREPLARYAVFVCPILSGSGVRVKLLEAFASGIPVVSTRIGAEGLARQDGEFCLLADDPGEFAEKVAAGIRGPRRASGANGRARARGSGGKLGHGRDHRAAGGELSGGACARTNPTSASAARGPA